MSLLLLAWALAVAEELRTGREPVNGLLALTHDVREDRGEALLQFATASPPLPRVTTTALPSLRKALSRMLITRPFDSAALELHPFICGEPELDTWLARYAGQSEKQDNVRTTLLLDEQQGRIAGYYSMRTFELSAADGASATGRSRRYPVPAMLIARLAVDRDYQGHGAGRLLLFDAPQKPLGCSGPHRLRDRRRSRSARGRCLLLSQARVPTVR
jgi:GNAT superfamily N-acetyltransferase